VNQEAPIMLKGSGGGGPPEPPPPPPPPVEEPNNLSSKARAKILDVICEGEIDAIEQINLDDTAIEKLDVTFDTRLGAMSQSYITGFDSVNNVKSVGVIVSNGSDVTRTINNLNADSVRVILRWGALFKQTTTGDILGMSIGLSVYINDVIKVNAVVTGKQNSVFERSYDVKLEGPGPWDVRVVRHSANFDELDSKIRSVFSWQTIEEIEYVKLTYPDTVVVGFEFDSKDFGGRFPSRSYLIRGRIIRIPVNYDPVTRVYSGIWDGTFKSMYSNNPAWVFYDLATNSRFGGNIPDDNIDKFALYSIAQYCDGSVDGEPRFQCNLVLETQRDAYIALQELATVFRGSAFYDTTEVSVTSDRPGQPVKLITNANVIDGRFTYQSSPLSERYSVAIVSWNNPALQYRLDQETITISDLMQKYGERKKTTTAIACTTRGQAHRFGRWLLITEEEESDLVSYETGYDQLDVGLGEIAELSDNEVVGVRLGGRVLEHDGPTRFVKIDGVVDFNNSLSYQIKIVEKSGVVAIRDLASLIGEQTDLTYIGDELDLVDRAVFVVQELELLPPKWRIVRIDETKKGYNVTANRYIDEKYPFIDSGLPAEIARTSLLEDQIAPRNLNIVKDVEIVGGSAGNIGLLSWDATPGAASYQLQIASAEALYDETFDLDNLSFTYRNVDGEYKARVRSVGIFSQVSDWVEIFWTFSLESIPADDVENFLSTWTGGGSQLTWTAVDHAVSYEIRRGDDWLNSIAISSTSATSLYLPTPQDGRYLIKATALWGGVSTNAPVIDIDNLDTLNFIAEFDWHALGFPLGTYKNMYLQLDGDLGMILRHMWESMTDPWATYTDPWEDYNYQQSPDLTSFCYESPVEDLGAVFTSRVDAAFSMVVSGDFNKWADFILPWGNYSLANGYTWENGVTSGIDPVIEVRWSLDNITFSPWTAISSALLTFRYLQSRVVITRNNTLGVAEITEFKTLVDVPDKTANVNDFVVDIAGSTLDYTAVGFFFIPSVIAGIQNGAVGDTVQVTAKTKTECIIKIFDSSLTQKAGLVDVIVRGG